MSRKPTFAERQRRNEQHAVQVAAAEKTLREHRKKQSATWRPGPAGVLGYITKEHARLLEMCKGTKLLDHGRHARNGHSYVDALCDMSKWEERYVRRPEDWKCRTHNADRQFSSLARHLFAKYEVPVFMDEAWPGDSQRQEWFINVGQGQNIRAQNGLPIPLTKRMAHETMRAPSDLTIDHALRWGQVLSMGGSPRTARAILGTMLGRSNSWGTDNFWVTVIRFFVSNPMLDVVHYGPIVDYLNNQRFCGQGAVWVGDEYRNIHPPQPNLSMSGRSPDALLAQVEKWHKNISKAERRRYCEWLSCGIPGLILHEGQEANEITWNIRELINSNELADEGKAMRHCVGSYASSCVKGSSAIYSMTKNSKRGIERRLTIEIEPSSKTIIQARGYANEWPDALDMRILSAWATKTGLQVSSYVRR